MWVAACDDDGRFEAWLTGEMAKHLTTDDSFSFYHSGAEMLDAVKAFGKPIDLLLLDMEMKGIDGLEAGKELREVSPETIIIVITEHREYALRCYELQPLGYLLKPVDTVKLAALVERARWLHWQKREPFRIDTKSDTIYIPYSDILYFEHKDRALYAHTALASYRFPGSFQGLMASIEEKGFFRVHKSFAANLGAIQHIDKSQCRIALLGGAVLPVGNRRIKELVNAVIQYRKDFHGAG